jgi:ubiquinone/menaquinone biosynthesis C-methylase UbiE
MKINLGGENSEVNGYKNLDLFPGENVSFVHDLNKFPYPFKDNSIEEIKAEDVLEHLDSIPKPLQEFHRICKNKAKIKIKVPIYPSELMFENPTHKLVFTRNTFTWFTKEKNLYYAGKAQFKIKSRKIYFYYPNSSRFPIKQIGKIYTSLINKSKFLEELYFNFSPFIIKPKFMAVVLEVLK